MFEVLAFVYQNYDAGESCPETSLLERRLSSMGFAADEIDDALRWLKDLDGAASPTTPDASLIHPATSSSRVYPPHEQQHLGAVAIGFLCFMETATVLSATLREVIIDRAMAAPGGPVSLDDLKMIVLMVYWRFGQKIDALILDELCTDTSERIAH